MLGPRPMHGNSQLLFQKYARPLFVPGCRVLEIGPDAVPSSFSRLVGAGPALWHTLDIGNRPGLTFGGCGEYAFPIADGAYDLVVSGQVVEHVRQIWRWIAELARVCRPGGHVVTIAPVTWGFHAEPVDCWRIYPEGMRALYEQAELDVLLATWESLEPRAWLPRCPRPRDDRRPGLPFKLARAIGWPLGRVYDTVAIGRKPGG
jgi:SAM-dependent methyltransferase